MRRYCFPMAICLHASPNVSTALATTTLENIVGNIVKYSLLIAPPPNAYAIVIHYFYNV
jgi:hypothetical protein